jgi:UDP-3-O-[3-hydroxymyristoyl] glucosamine N-acyltransferase
MVPAIARGFGVSGYEISEIATALSGELVGDASLRLSGACEPASARADQLAVAMDPRYAGDLARGQARAALLWQGADWQGFGLRAAILIARPRLAMAALTALMHTRGDAAGAIHPTALIGAGAQIGPGAGIGPYAVIGDGVSIGARALIGAHCSIAAGATLGEDCVLGPGARIGQRVTIGARFHGHPGIVIGADGFSFVTAEKSTLEGVRESLGQDMSGQGDQSWLKIHSLGGVEIGDDVEVGANSSVDAGTLRATRIGDGTKLDALVQVGHNVRVGRNCLLCAHVAVGGSADLGNGVVLGGQAGVADNIRIGDGVIAGGASKILSNVPAGRAILGYPAVKMSTHVETYKALRRLPKALRELAARKNSVSNGGGND